MEAHSVDKLPIEAGQPQGYHGWRRKFVCVVIILPSGALLQRGTEHVNHSPDGFEWGYGGSGPAQLAFAILLHHSGLEAALSYYQRFKAEVIQNITDDTWTIPKESVTKWLEATIKAEEEKEKEELENPN